jgi:transcription initiation factor TFIID TATA-box-binding protein
MNIVQNIVSTAYLGTNIDLEFITKNAVNIQYNRKKFTAAIIRLRKPKTTTLLFHTGKIVCTGASSIEENKKAARIIARIIQKIYRKDKKIKFLDYLVQNIVACFKVPFKIDLIAFNLARPKNTFYDASIFPGLKFKPYTSSKTTILIFISGKLVITGVKEMDSVYEVKEYIERLLLRFKRPFPYITC